jgi:hypothetical protein
VIRYTYRAFTFAMSKVQCSIRIAPSVRAGLMTARTAEGSRERAVDFGIWDRGVNQPSNWREGADKPTGRTSSGFRSGDMASEEATPVVVASEEVRCREMTVLSSPSPFGGSSTKD